MKQSLKHQAGWTKWQKRLCLLGALLGTMPAARAQAPRFSVTSEQVVALMQGHAWPVEGLHVTLPAAITASVENPGLGITTASMLTAHEARLRIVCRVPAACLPFFATAVWPVTAESIALPADQNSGSAGRRPEPVLGANQNSAGWLRAGASVTLILEGARVHVQMQVVSLQGGAPGDKIRVESRDRRQTFVAEIVTPKLLKASLSQ